MTMEFIVMVAFAVIIGLIFLALAGNVFSDVTETQRRDILYDMGYMLQDEIILATQVEDGYTRTILIPNKLDRFPYTISNTPTGITLTSSRVTATFSIPEISGMLAKGPNTITKDGTVTIS